MKPPDPLERLAALARQAPPTALAEMSFGFDTRIAALVSARVEDPARLWEWCATRAVVAAAILCATALAVRHTPPPEDLESRMATSFLEATLR